MEPKLADYRGTKYWTLRPYFDLQSSNTLPLFAQGPLFAFRELERGHLGLGLYRAVPPGFRLSLIRESGLIGYSYRNPSSTPPTLRSAAWENLVDMTQRFANLSKLRKALVSRLLSYLGFHGLVENLLKAYLDSSDTSPEGLYLRSLAQYTRKYVLGFSESDVVKAIKAMPPGTRGRFQAALGLAVYHFNITKSGRGLSDALAVMRERIDNPPDQLPAFEATLELSRYRMALSFQAALQHNETAALNQLRRAEKELQDSSGRSPLEDILVKEQRTFILMSRIEIAEQFGNTRTASKAADQLTNEDPFWSLAHLERGKQLFQAGNLAEALKEFRTAARLGPPATALARFYSAVTHERLGQLELAADEYIDSLRTDPLGVSATRGFTAVAKKLKDPALVELSKRYRSLYPSGRLPKC